MGPNGTREGMDRSTAPAWRRAYLAIAVLTGAIDTVNVFTVLSDSERYGTHLARWEPIVWEGTSGLATLVACGIAYRALRIALPGRARWPVTILVHGIGSLLFSVSHVALMTLARTAIYDAMGLRYRAALADWPYEYRKDIIAYILIAGLFWILGRQHIVEPRVAPPPSTFDIVDGTSLLRVAVADICAVRAAGNYVEFHLGDGRTPLMRASLRQIEAELGPYGLVRTHRSWLVNGARIGAIDAVGSGDYSLDMGTSTRVPLSRRYPDALHILRGH